VVSSFFSSPRSEIGCRPYFHTWRGLSVNLECRCAACSSPKIQYAKIRHLGTIPQLCRAISSQLRHVETIGKKNLLSSNISSTCPHNMVNFGPLAAEIVTSSRFGAPLQISTGFVSRQRYCMALVGVSQTLRRWTEDAAYIRQGGHHVGHWPTFLVLSAIHRVKWHHSNLWSHYDLCVVRQLSVLS